MTVIERFLAKNTNGHIYNVVLIQEAGPVFRPVSGPATPTKGRKHYELDTGEHVNKISETEFEIVFTDRHDNEKIIRIA